MTTMITKIWDLMRTEPGRRSTNNLILFLMKQNWKMSRKLSHNIRRKYCSVNLLFSGCLLICKLFDIVKTQSCLWISSLKKIKRQSYWITNMKCLKIKISIAPILRNWWNHRLINCKNGLKRMKKWIKLKRVDQNKAILNKMMTNLKRSKIK